MEIRRKYGATRDVGNSQKHKPITNVVWNPSPLFRRPHTKNALSDAPNVV